MCTNCLCCSAERGLARQAVWPVGARRGQLARAAGWGCRPQLSWPCTFVGYLQQRGWDSGTDEWTGQQEESRGKGWPADGEDGGRRAFGSFGCVVDEAGEGSDRLAPCGRTTSRIDRGQPTTAPQTNSQRHERMGARMAIGNVAPLWPGNEVFEPTPSCLVHTCGRIPVLFISALIIPLSAIQTPLEDVRCPLLSVVISCEMEMSEMPGARVLTLRNKEAGVEAQNNAGTLTSAREMQSGRASGNWLSGWSRL